uniref:Uncharacterized protein n=1 Tax=Oryza meridionalis TaxID=40149 RepID=A0A0E0D9H3_9ORYZ
MSAAATAGTYSPASAAGEKRRERKEELRRHLAEDADWPRADGRSFHDCRPAFMQTGPTTAASGSAYAEFGKTKVIVSVFGPRESKKAMLYSDTGRLNCNVSYTTFATPIRGQGTDNKEYSAMLHKALEGAVMLHTFPKTTVDVFALVLESGGSDLPIIISCASLALADAGIMMYDLVTSVSVSCFGKNIIIDPTSDEEAWQDGSLMVAYMPARKEITQLTLTGEWSDGKITNAVELCMDACSKLCDILRERLKDASSLAESSKFQASLFSSLLFSCDRFLHRTPPPPPTAAADDDDEPLPAAAGAGAEDHSTGFPRRKLRHCSFSSADFALADLGRS